MKTIAALSAIAALGILLMAVPVAAQERDDESRRSELGERQRLVVRKMSELESRFEAIAFKLEAKEPERAKRLVEALQKARQDLIVVKMEEITKLLDERRFQQAEAELDLVIVKLDELVRLLLDDRSRELTRQQEIEKLEKWKQELNRIRADEERQRRETDKIANKDQTLADLARRIAAVEALIQRQEKVVEAAPAVQNGGIQAHEKLADEQFDVRQATEKLLEEISGGQAKNAPVEVPVDTPADLPAEEKGTGESAGGNEKPSEPKEGGGKSSGDAGGSKPDAGKPDSQGDSSPAAQPRKPEPGEAPLKSASGNQAEAEKQLGEQKATDARRAAEKATDDLRAALEELKREQRRIASLPPEAFQQMSQEQMRTEKETGDIAREMQQTPKGSTKSGEEGKGEEGGEKGSGESRQGGQPGQQSVQRAQKAMQNAGQDLDDQESGRAARQQEKAVEELDKALRDIEERLDQLREETREEKLARLEARFREMLARQRLASIVTVDVDEKKVNLNRVRNRDVLGMMRLAGEESEIGELGQQAYDLLMEDGTSVVFPEMVQVLREDLIRVSEMLDREETGQVTQLVQREIESGLEELIEALKKSRQEGQQGGGGGGGGNQPLLRKSAEFKMLRAAQLRVNRLTAQFDTIRGEGKLGEPLRQELDHIRTRQAEIVEMLVRIMEKE